MSKKFRILMSGDGVAPTGFARVTESIASHLQNDFEFHHLAVNFHGDPHDLPWRVYPAQLGGPSPHGVHRIRELILNLDPDLVFIVNDLWVVTEFLSEIRKISTKRPPIVVYSPVDATPVEIEILQGLTGIDRLITYTQFARRTIEEGLVKQRELNPEFEFPEVEVIPHGVDSNFFAQMEEKGGETGRLRARKALFPDRTDLHDSFLVLNANRNQPRKRIDTTMEGFALFAEGKPRDAVKLFLHMGVKDIGWDIIQLARRFDIEDKLVLSTLSQHLPRFSRKHLNYVYNAAEVGINTSSSEGWGLVSFEHAATGAAQIVPGFGPCEELWDGKALLLPPTQHFIYPQSQLDGYFVDAERLAEHLETLFQNSEVLADYSERALGQSQRAELQWSAIAKRWQILFEEVLQAT